MASYKTASFKIIEARSDKEKRMDKFIFVNLYLILNFSNLIKTNYVIAIFTVYAYGMKSQYLK
jgi:hypothetical protein